MPQEGILVQIDGSEHPWLEDRGPKLTLLIAFAFQKWGRNRWTTTNSSIFWQEVPDY